VNRPLTPKRLEGEEVKMWPWVPGQILELRPNFFDRLFILYSFQLIEYLGHFSFQKGKQYVDEVLEEYLLSRYMCTSAL
jgi:hypothetical protein